MLLYITKNMNPNYSVIPCFVEKKSPKQHLKSVLYQKKVYAFLPQIPPTLLFFSKKELSISSCFPPLFSRTFPLLNHPKSHHYDPKQQEFKIQTNKIP